MKTLLEVARDRDLPELTRCLSLAVREFCRTNSPRSVMDEGEQLLDEALTYAKLGDLDEAEHRLRLRAHPKWRSKIEYKLAYEKAMGR